MTTLDFPLDGEQPEPLPFIDRAGAAYRHAAAGLHFPGVEVLEPEDPRRRLRAALDAEYFAGTYFPEQYYRPAPYHTGTMDTLQGQVLTTEQVIFRTVDAAPRSIGKSTIARLVAAWGLLNAHLRMALWLGFKAENAAQHVISIKDWLLTSDRLCADYPEICMWVRAFGGNSKACPPGYFWQDGQVKLPNRTFTLARGIDSALVGMNIEGVRPDFVVMDDIETVASVYSDAETKGIGRRIDMEVLRLHDMNRRAIYYLIGNPRVETSNVARYLDPHQSPGWAGRVHKGLNRPPAATARWTEYVEIAAWRQALPDECGAAFVPDETAAAAAEISPAKFAKYVEQAEKQREELLAKGVTPPPGAGLPGALRYYAVHKEEMDAGAELLDPVRLPLWECYRIIAQEGLKLFTTEIQNEHWKDEEVLDVREWTPAFIKEHATGYPPLALPHDCPAEFVTFGGDLHKEPIYYVFRAWAMDGTSWLIEAGVSEVHLHEGDDAERERIQRARLRSLWEIAQEGFKVGSASGAAAKILPFRMGFLDESWEQQVARAACRETGWRFRPVRGRAGLATRRFRKVEDHKPSLLLGVDHFKHDLARLLQRTRGAAGVSPGYFHLHNTPSHAYTQHMCAERWQPKQRRAGTDVVEFEWYAVNRNNHWWDCEVYALAAAVACGVRVALEDKPPEPARRPAGLGEPRKPGAAAYGASSPKKDGWNIGRGGPERGSSGRDGGWTIGR